MWFLYKKGNCKRELFTYLSTTLIHVNTVGDKKPKYIDYTIYLVKMNIILQELTKLE